MAPTTFRRALLSCAIATQVLVPAIALLQPPTRLGFQMYSGRGGTEVAVFDALGNSIDVEIEGYVAGTLRPELDWTRNLPEHLCASIADAARVTVTRPDQSRTRTVEC